MARYKFNTKISVTDDKRAEKEIRVTSPFTIDTNNIKCLVVKQVEDLYDKNLNLWKKKLKKTPEN